MEFFAINTFGFVVLVLVCLVFLPVGLICLVLRKLKNQKERQR